MNLTRAICGWDTGAITALAGGADMNLMGLIPWRSGLPVMAHLPDIAFFALLTGVLTGVVAWVLHLRARQGIEKRTGRRIGQMTELIEQAQCVLWEAEVVLETGDWQWHMRLHPSVFGRQLFRGHNPGPRDDLWIGFQVETRAEMDRVARAAIESGKPGYEQEFRAGREGRTYWLKENVSITPLGGDRYRLVGLITDLTAQREAEAARRQSELTVERILAHAECMIWRATVLEEEGQLHWPHFDVPQSQLSEQLFGVNRVYIRENGFWESLEMPDQAQMDERSTRAILDGQKGYAQQFRVINRQGRAFWLQEQVSISPLGDRMWSLVGVVTDITARREAEEAQRRSETRLAYLLERADSMIWQARVERQADGPPFWTMFIPRSQLYRRIFGTDPQNPEGFAWDKKGVPEHAEMERRAHNALLDNLAGYDQVFHVAGPEGDIWLSETVTVMSTGPEAWDLVGIITDITARRQAEEAWRSSQARLGQLLELADCMVWEATVVLRPDDILDWDQYIPPSALYRRIFGEPENGKARLSWECVTIPEFPEMIARTLTAVKTAAPGYNQEFHVVQAEGDLWLRETVTIVPLGPGEFRMVGVITDITPQRRAEAAHQRSEQRLATLLERSDCMIWQGECRRLAPDEFVWDVFTPRSQLFRRIFGRDPEGQCHFDWTEAMVPEFFEMRDRGRHAMTTGQPGYEQTFHYQHAEGDIWLSEKVTIKPVKPDHWELVGIITDITQHQKSEAARRMSDQRLQDLLARAECLLWEANAELKTHGWEWQFKIQPSLLCQKLYGSPQPLAEAGLWRSFDIPEREKMDERCRSAMCEGRPGYDQVFRIMRPDGAAVWISENVTIRSLGSNRFSLVGVAVDITAQRGAEEALAAEKERLAVTLRAMHESVITTDTAGRIQFMNPAAAQLTEWSIEECKGRMVQEICVLESGRHGGPVDVPVARVSLGDVVADLPGQTRLAARSGKRRQVEGCCAPIHAMDSKVIGTVLVLRDVTEQERLEQELVRATRLESVGVLAGGIAHDFNNILTAVMGNLALAQLDIPADSPAGLSVRSAEKAALRARDLTQQLLTFAKGGDPVRAAVQLAAVVREMAAFALHGSQVRAHYDLAPDLWPADADKGQIGRVVQNLVINAVQAMPRGGTLQIVARNDPHGGINQPGLALGNYIQMAITDTGEGIKAENIARIFDPYFTTKQTGTGLGLAAVYSIIKKHRGHIEVESQAGQGTTFRFWLPALSGEKVAVESNPPWTGGPSGPMKGRVLFMDDEQIIRDMAVSLLERFGLKVDCAEDGAEAVEKYRAALADGRRYDLVIMDLTVPGGMGGLAALGQLREFDPTVKAVVSSGYSSDPVLANFRAHGFAAVVAKPYEVGEITRVLREMLPGT